ncbi:MAG: hypothetical protein U9M97_04240 [Candidatus Hadarchaeota archaeon]|nr:hypothetical protein [Candidatus Hadarchaeota archaeon]
MDDGGKIVWRILFGVVMAIMLLGIFLVYLSAQSRFAVGEGAQALANDLSYTCFSAFTQQQPTYELPSSVGGANYELEVENNTFVVRVTSGSLRGNEYRSIVGVDLDVRSLPSPGGTLYVQGRPENVIVAAEHISPSPQGFGGFVAPEPPSFYFFAKENQREAAAIVASYFYACEHYRGEENLDILGYEWAGENLLAQVSSDGELVTGLRVLPHESEENVGLVDNSWVVEEVEDVGENVGGIIFCPSVENAVSCGWVYPPSEVVRHLRSRAWRMRDNTIVALPEDISWRASAVTTNVASYPTWRFKFRSDGNRFVIHFAMIPWAPGENQPGFVFQSRPELEALI